MLGELKPAGASKTPEPVKWLRKGKASLYGLIAFMLEVILARTQVRVMSDRKQISRKKPLKELIKPFAPLIPILGIPIGSIYLPYNNAVLVFLHAWLLIQDFDLMALYYTYLSKDDLQSPNAKRRLSAIRGIKLEAAIAYIFTAGGIFTGGFVLASYLIYLRAVALGLTKLPAPMMSQEVILISLLLVTLPIPAYVVKRETKKAIRLGMKNATNT